MSKAAATTPIGVARYPRLTEPDTKFDDNGVYSTKLILSEEDYQAYADVLNPWVEQEYKRFCTEAGKDSLRRNENTPLRINSDGEHEVYAKQVAVKQTSKGQLTFSVTLFDSQGKKINSPPNIGSGSKLRLMVEPVAWFVPAIGFGYTLRLKAAQVIELVEFTGGGGYSFDAHEGGYVSENLDESLPDNAEVPF
jgi:hypothetical protein|tara:strand:+ start:3644 stop:4225 length:582 start_codon:yes stop_codon:yes gene_type:complete